MGSFRSVLIGVLIGALAAGSGVARAEPGGMCEAAAGAVEAVQGIPAGLLRAIGAVETGRGAAGAGWPYAVGEAGGGRLLATTEAAEAWAAARLAAGVRSIDVGCFQINLLHHPGAFARLADGFDPGANARVAGELLARLKGRLGTWEAAAAAYHSSTPERGAAYVQRVLAAWGRGGAPPGMAREVAGEVAGVVAGAVAAGGPRVIRLGVAEAGLPRIIRGGRGGQWPHQPNARESSIGFGPLVGAGGSGRRRGLGV